MLAARCERWDGRGKVFAICRRVGAGGGLSIALGIRRAKDELVRGRREGFTYAYLPKAARLSSSPSQACASFCLSRRSSRSEVRCEQSVNGKGISKVHICAQRRRKMKVTLEHVKDPQVSRCIHTHIPAFPTPCLFFTPLLCDCLDLVCLLL